MSTPIALPSDLATYLGVDPTKLDDDRATLMLQLAQDKCESLLSPLPDTALGVVLDVAARAYTNVTNAQTESAGPFQVSHGAISGGMWLTRANMAELRRLGASSGAFSVDPTPADAGPTLVYPQIPIDPQDVYAGPPFYGDWDWPPMSP